MTKEQETRIKLLKDFTKMDFSNPMGWTGYYDTELKELSEAVETALNIIKEKDEEIESLKEIKKIADSKITDLPKMIHYDGLKSEIWILQTKLKEKDKEIENKDKIIDLMAKAFKQDDIRTVEEIIEYFERKSKEC